MNRREFFKSAGKVICAAALLSQPAIFSFSSDALAVEEELSWDISRQCWKFVISWHDKATGKNWYAADFFTDLDDLPFVRKGGHFAIKRAQGHEGYEVPSL